MVSNETIITLKSITLIFDCTGISRDEGELPYFKVQRTFLKTHLPEKTNQEMTRKIFLKSDYAFRCVKPLESMLWITGQKRI